jgi:hypothetical protein
MSKSQTGFKIVHLKVATLASNELTLNQCVLKSLTNFFITKKDKTSPVAKSSTDIN